MMMVMMVIMMMVVTDRVANVEVNTIVIMISGKVNMNIMMIMISGKVGLVCIFADYSCSSELVTYNHTFNGGIQLEPKLLLMGG